MAGAAATTVRVLVVPIAMPLQGGRPERSGLLFIKLLYAPAPRLAIRAIRRWRVHPETYDVMWQKDKEAHAHLSPCRPRSF